MSIIRCSVIDTFNENTPPEVLSEELCKIIDEIWKNGLSVDYFYKLSDIFIHRNDLNLEHRKLILQCLVPQFVVDEEVVEKLLLWYFSMYLKDSEASANLLSWIAALIECKLIKTCTLEKYYGQLVTTFQAECLINPLCKVLMNVTNERTVNKRSAFLVQEFYKEFLNAHLKLLLWEVKKFRPSDVVVSFNSVPKNKIQKSDFERAIMKIARKQGIVIDDIENEKLIPGMLPEAEYCEDIALPYKKLTNVVNATELGCLARKSWVKLPNNPVSLLGSKIGMIYLELFGPNEEFLGGLNSIIKSQPSTLSITKLSEFQNRLRHGLPIVTDYLARYLITWDGLDEPQLVYELIKWAHFDDFDDLSSKILIPLARLYICSNVDVKVGILDTLSGLLINMVSIHMERLPQEQSKFDHIPRAKWLDNPMDTVTKLYTHVQSLIIVGLSWEGFDCSSVLLEAIKFYNIMVSLQLEFSLLCFITPSPAVVYAALTSLNHVVINEVCSLLMRYKKNLIPFMSNLGKAEDFSADIDLINEISDIIFNYLWLGEDIFQRIEQSCTNLDRIRKHPGIFPLIEFLSRTLKLNPRKIQKSQLLLMMSATAEGIGEFINYHLEKHSS